MENKKIIWQIFPAIFLILALTVICVTWFGKVSLQSFYLKEQEKGLAARAFLVRPIIAEMLETGEIEKLRKYSKNTGRKSNTRVTVILPDGRVIADSNENPDAMEMHNNRVEIIKAMKGEIGSSLRYSRTLGQEMLYVAVPVFKGSSLDHAVHAKAQVVTVLRMSVPVDAIEVAMKSISKRILMGILGVVLLAAAASLLVSRNISKPLEEIKNAAERFSRGDFSRRMSAHKGASASLEVVTLAAAMDKMAGQLDERIETIVSQRNELETVFSSMVESVIAVDQEERVININKAAATLLGIDRDLVKGRIIQEVLRNINMQQQISQVLRTGVSMEDEIVHYDNVGEKYLQTNIVSLNDKNSNVLGVLVVMNDVTKMRRLENVRRDFVANVSHELRTPITSIRGYVETLLDGAIENRDDALNFLEIVLRQAERLNEIIEDLLVLSRIEQEADNGHIKLEEGRLFLVLDVATETCQLKAEKAGVSISLDCPDEIQLEMNGILLEQAVVNLLVNAIRYSKPGGRIDVTARETSEQGQRCIQIDVVDYGVGIAANHLPRLFERFYRSDKARSRKQGGTGLGLAIVKHIVLAHNGKVDVKSEVGVGSTFTIIIPG